MNIPRFWSSSDPRKSFLCWHWSNVSVEEARTRAEEKSHNIAARWTRGEDLHRYAYGNAAIREEVVQTVPTDAGGPIAIITRNVYGSLVLNTDQVMFIDIDFPPRPRRWLGRLFSRPHGVDEFEQPALENLHAFAARHCELSVRVYRTFAGLRCLVTSRLFDPADAQTISLLQSAGSDPLYIRLCQTQACFRARLSPKPWRIGAKVPPTRYPFTSEKQLGEYRRWQTEYAQAIARFSVCRFLTRIGPERVLPQIHPIVEMHDRFTEIATNRPLA